MGFSAHSFFHEEVIENEDAQEAFSLLTLVANNEDRAALRFYLGCKSPTFLKSQYARLRDQCAEVGESPFFALSRMADGQVSAVGFADILTRFRALRMAIANVGNLNGSELVDAIFPPNSAWAEPLRDLLAGVEIDPFTIPEEVLKIIRDYVTQPEVPTNPDFVRIMSLHASKGLTAEVAIVAGVVNSAVPFIDVSATPDEAARTAEEQRRLFYVAITRGRQVLVLSSPARIPAVQAFRMNIIVGQNDATQPSPFFREMGGPGRRAINGADWVAGGYA